MTAPRLTSLTRATAYLNQLPGIGEKTALRLALHILRARDSYAQELAQSISDLKEKIRLCITCGSLQETLTEKTDVPQLSCTYCDHPARTKEIICVIEDITDMMAIERSQPSKWSYHVLHGVLSPLDGITPKDLKIKELLERMRSGIVREVILAMNPSVEGEATASYLAKLLSPLGVKLTRIAQGVPMGSHLEYLDHATLGHALVHRQEIGAS